MGKIIKKESIPKPHIQPFFLLQDLCGNITALINTEIKKIQESYFYNAFGEEETFSDNNILNSWKFSSKRKDPETDLIFFGRRYYDPSEGRFCAPDPLGLTNSMNLYAFALNDPLMRIDLYGLMAILQYPLMGTEPLFSMEPYNTSQSATPAAIDFAKGCYWGYNEVYSGNSLHMPITPAELYGQRFGRSLGMAQGISEMCMGTYITAAGIAGQIGSGIGTIGTGGTASMVTVPVFAASLATTAAGGMVSVHGYSMFKNAQNLPELKSGSSIKSTKRLKPDPKATGAHSVIKRNPTTGKIEKYATYRPQTNPYNPNEWELVKRYDGLSSGPGTLKRSHFNKIIKENVPEPHVHDPSFPGGIRPAYQWEIPRAIILK